jgi:hypothetical protein
MDGIAMPLPKRLAGFNARVTNRLTRRVAGRLPGFGIVSHVGRRSGRAYRTPVNVFRDGKRTCSRSPTPARAAHRAAHERPDA